MNSVVIFLVPAGATQRDLETALREHADSLGVDATQAGEQPKQSDLEDAEELPMWTWFLPNARA